MKHVSLAEICESIDYGVTASASSAPVGPKFLRITDIQDGDVNWDTVPYCVSDERKLVSSKLMAGDIVFARTGATTGKSFLISSCPANAVFASYLIRVRPSRSVIPTYLGHFFNSPNYWNQISLKAVGAAQPGINASKLKELKIPLPPLEEQKRIAAILDQADALRRLRRRALDRLNNLGQAIFHEMSADFETGDEAGFAEIASIQVGYPFKSEQYTAAADGVRLCRGANVLPGVIDWGNLALYPREQLTELSQFQLEEGDIVLAMDRPWISSGFKVASVRRHDLPSYLVQRVARFRAFNADDQAFIWALLNSFEFQRHCKPTETTIPHISPREIKDFRFKLPAPAVRARLNRLMAEVHVLGNQISSPSNSLNALFTSLQHRAFRGEL